MAKRAASQQAGMMKVLSLLPAVIRPAEIQADGIMAPGDGWDGKGVRRLASGVLPMVEWERPGSCVIGAFRAMREHIGVNDSRIYDFADPETGELFGVWGATILDQRMDATAPQAGDFVRIVYLGDVETGRGQNAAHNFEVAVRPKAMGLPAPAGK
jgi:hypothetical protein